MSAEAVGWVFRYSPYSGATFAVHLAIADSVNDQGGYVFWMRQQVCADKARVGRPAVNTAIKQMVADGLLVVVEVRPGGANRYAFVMPTGMQSRFGSNSTPRNRGVSPQTTPPDEAAEEPLQDTAETGATGQGVVTDDTPTDPGEGVAHDNTGCRPSEHQVLSQRTQNPKRTQELTQTSSAAARRDDATGPDVTAEEEELIEAALKVLADRHLKRRKAEGPVQFFDRWMTATVASLRNQHTTTAAQLVAAGGHTADTLADALEPTSPPAGGRDVAARAIAERDRSCPDCRGTGHRFDDTLNAAVPCTHNEAA